MAAPNPPSAADHSLSPTLSNLTTSLSDSMTSVDLLSSIISRSLQITEDEDSGDEIVWNVSVKSSSISSENEHGGTSGEDDFVLVNRPHSPAGFASNTSVSNPLQDGVENGPHAPITGPNQDRLRAVTLKQSSQPKERKKKPRTLEPTASSGAKSGKKKMKKALRTGSLSSVHAFTEPLLQVSKAREIRPVHTKPSLHPTETQWFEEMAIVKFTGLGARPVVDDYSDGVSVVSVDNESVGYPTIYEEASTFISSFLSNPEAKHDTVCRLTLLQSLIIELGLATASLPESLSAATAFLKSRAFLNIREYLAVREQGPEAVQRVLYPSKSALIKDIKKRRNRASVKWVKQHGLQVFLVGWTHH